MPSPIVTSIRKAIPTAKPKIQIETRINFRVEDLPGKGKHPKAQLIREGHKTETGPADEIRKRAAELEKESAIWRVSCRGYPNTEHDSEKAANDRAEEIRKQSAIIYTGKILPASKGLDILPRLLSLFGDTLVALLMTGEATTSQLLKDPKVIAGIVAKLASRAAETGDLEAIVKDLMVGLEADKIRIGEVEVPGKVMEHFDEHFAGRLSHMFEVALWVAQENFLEP